jgi:hypothetical protein
MVIDSSSRVMNDSVVISSYLIRPHGSNVEKAKNV